MPANRRICYMALFSRFQEIYSGCCTVAARALALAFGALIVVRCLTCKTAHFRSGAEGTRTPGLRRAKAALSQLSYGPRNGKMSLRVAGAFFNESASAGRARAPVAGLPAGRARRYNVPLL